MQTSNMAVYHGRRPYRVVRYDYPRRGNLYFDGSVNRVKCAGRDIMSHKHLILTEGKP